MLELLSTLQGLGLLFGQPLWKRHLELTTVLRSEVIVVGVPAARRSVRTLGSLGDSTMVGVAIHGCQRGAASVRARIAALNEIIDAVVARLADCRRNPVADPTWPGHVCNALAILRRVRRG